MLPTDEKSLATACDTDVIDDEFSGACNVVLVPTLDSRESRDPMSLTPGQSLLPAWHFPTCHRQSSLRRERAKNDGLCLQFQSIVSCMYENVLENVKEVVNI